MAHQHYYQSPFGDTTFTKVFVGGLAWDTPTDVMRSYFQQFGEILEAVIINDKITGKSKGYGFVTFRDPESAKRACADPNPVIGGRRANCNIASLGRPRPSPPKGRDQMGIVYPVGGTPAEGASPLYWPLPPSTRPPLAPRQPVMYSAYGYTAYPPDYGYHQPMYSPSSIPYQVYGAPSSTVGAPYYYGYSMQTPSPRGTFSLPTTVQRLQGPSYLYYSTQVEAASSSYAPPPLSLVPPPTEAGAPQTSTETEAGPAALASSTV